MFKTDLPLKFIIDTFAFINEYMEAKQLEKICKALGDLQRMKILKVMSKQGGTIQCAEIMTLIDLAQPSISHHIKTLTEAGLIIPEKDGRQYSYKLNKSLINDFIGDLKLIAKE